MASAGQLKGLLCVHCHVSGPGCLSLGGHAGGTGLTMPCSGLPVLPGPQTPLSLPAPGVGAHLYLLGNIRSQSLHSCACPSPLPRPSGLSSSPRSPYRAAPTAPHAYFLWRRRSSLDWKSSSHTSQRNVGSSARERGQEVGRQAPELPQSPWPARGLPPPG